MDTFFRGWRRKVGLMTLLLACAFAVASVRSRFLYDSFAIVDAAGLSLDSINSDSMGLVYLSYRSKEEFTYDVVWDSGPLGGGFVGYVSKRQGPFLSRVCGCRVGDLRGVISTGDRLIVVAIPYWILILVLTLLSACLILWTPRRRTTLVRQ